MLKKNEKLYLITAKHVLLNKENILHGLKAELTCQTKDINDDSITKLIINLEIVEAIYHNNADVA